MPARNSDTPHRLIAMIMAAILFCFSVTAFAIWCIGPSGSKSDARAGEQGNSSNLNNPLQALLGKSNSRPKGILLNDGGGAVESPEVVDELWSRLQGKWDVLPNPDLKASLEYNPDYSITIWQAIRAEPELRVTKKLASIQDRTTVGIAWKVIRPGDRHYQFVYETPKNMSDSGTLNVNADGTISEGNTKFYRVGPPGSSGVKSLEENIWNILLGSQWSRSNPALIHVLTFRKDKSVSLRYQPLDNKPSKLIVGTVSGIRKTKSGFIVQLGRHTVDGRTLPSGELGEFYFGGQHLRQMNAEGNVMQIFEPKPVGTE